jgi:hypothetical protein
MSTSTRSPLPWPYVAILIAEAIVLTVLYASHRPEVPLQYEIGWAGTISMLLMQVYSLRRRMRILWRFGAISHWLEAHIFLGLQGFLFVVYHSVGVQIDTGFASMNIIFVTVIVVSGLFGRYLYGRLPRTHFALTQRIAQATVLHDAELPGASMLRSISAKSMSRLATTARVMGQAERWFSHWTLLHRPLAFFLLGVTFLHVLAHFLYAA